MYKRIYTFFNNSSINYNLQFALGQHYSTSWGKILSIFLPLVNSGKKRNLELSFKTKSHM